MKLDARIARIADCRLGVSQRLGCARVLPLAAETRRAAETQDLLPVTEPNKAARHFAWGQSNPEEAPLSRFDAVDDGVAGFFFVELANIVLSIYSSRL